MEDIRIECNLPFLLGLQDGRYGTLRLQRDPKGTHVSREFRSKSNEDLEAKQAKEARTLLVEVNRLIRWYKLMSLDSLVEEVALWRASPFQFSKAADNQPWGNQWLSFSSLASAADPFPGAAQTLSDSVRAEFEHGKEPPVSVLFLFDARRALDEGRFREAVLFSWSTIDSIFNHRFNALADRIWSREPVESRQFIKGEVFGMRNKMSVGLRMLAGRSFFDEPNELWKRLSESYKNRNTVIHAGAIATEDQAQNAIGVAEDVVRIMNEIASAHSLPD
jgi:hypothetical protein